MYVCCLLLAVSNTLTAVGAQTGTAETSAGAAFSTPGMALVSEV